MNPARWRRTQRDRVASFHAHAAHAAHRHEIERSVVALGPVDGNDVIRRPLKALVEELDPAWFWPIHRSTIGNVTAVAGVTRDARGRMVIRLKSRNERLTVSTAREHLFRQM